MTGVVLVDIVDWRAGSAAFAALPQAHQIPWAAEINDVGEMVHVDIIDPHASKSEDRSVSVTVELNGGRPQIVIGTTGLDILAIVHVRGHRLLIEHRVNAGVPVIVLDRDGWRSELVSAEQFDDPKGQTDQEPWPTTICVQNHLIRIDVSDGNSAGSDGSFFAMLQMNRGCPELVIGAADGEALALIWLAGNRLVLEHARKLSDPAIIIDAAGWHAVRLSGDEIETLGDRQFVANRDSMPPR